MCRSDLELTGGAASRGAIRSRWSRAHSLACGAAGASDARGPGRGGRVHLRTDLYTRGTATGDRAQPDVVLDARTGRAGGVELIGAFGVVEASGASCQCAHRHACRAIGGPSAGPASAMLGGDCGGWRRRRALAQAKEEWCCEQQREELALRRA